MPTGRMYHPRHAAHGSAPDPLLTDAANDPAYDQADVPVHGNRQRRGARRIGIVAACAVAVLGLVPAASQADPAPSAAEPTIAEVAAQVDALYVEMSAAVETYNQANVASGESRARLDTLQSNLARLQADYDAAAEQTGLIAAAQYRTVGSDPALQMLMSDDATDFLGRMSALDQIADRQAQTVATLEDAKVRLDEQQRAVERETDRLDTLAATLETAMRAAETKHASAQELLERLTAEERARVAAEQAARAAAAAEAAERAAEDAAAQTEATDEAADDDAADDDAADDGEPAAPPPPADPPPASGRAEVAVDFALAQVGDAYVWGASGPDAWDCSGLTSGAWGAAGVSLPHSSGAQFGTGTSVPSSQLQPGDLVFYYSPISHVGIYIGNGNLVHAANPSKPVHVAPVFSMPFAGARRVG